MSNLEHKVALVTGASKGIGAGIAKDLAAAGAAIAVNYATDQAGAEAVVEEIRSLNSRAVAIQADVSKSTDVSRLLVEVKKTFGRARYSGEQCRRVSTNAAGGTDGRRDSSGIQHQCPGPVAGNPECVGVLRPGWRQRDQYRIYAFPQGILRPFKNFQQHEANEFAWLRTS